jgi:RNA polymerase-binding transcription factor DksA
MSRSKQLNVLKDQLKRRLTELGQLRGADEALHAVLSGIDEAEVALRRAEQGRYGQCIECEKPIPLIRLRTKPEAIRCVSCQNVHERNDAGRPRIRLAFGM